MSTSWGSHETYIKRRWKVGTMNTSKLVNGEREGEEDGFENTEHFSY